MVFLPEQFGESVDGDGGDVLDAVCEGGGRAAVRHGAALEGARAPDAARAAGGPGVAWRRGLRSLKLHGIHLQNATRCLDCKRYSTN